MITGKGAIMHQARAKAAAKVKGQAARVMLEIFGRSICQEQTQECYRNGWITLPMQCVMQSASIQWLSEALQVQSEMQFFVCILCCT
jgi:hypothetical protein